MNESKLLGFWQIMIKEKKTYTYVCDECKKEFDLSQFGDTSVDLGSSNDVAYEAIINIRTYMSYRGDCKDICYKCKLKILKKAVVKLEKLISEE